MSHFHCLIPDAEYGPIEDVVCALHEAQGRAIDPEPLACDDACTRCWVCEAERPPVVAARAFAASPCPRCGEPLDLGRDWIEVGVIGDSQTIHTACAAPDERAYIDSLDNLPF